MRTIKKILFIVPSWNRAGGESVVKNISEEFSKIIEKIIIISLTNEVTAPRPQKSHFISFPYSKLPIIKFKNFIIFKMLYIKEIINKIRCLKPDIIHYHLIEGIHSLIIPVIHCFIPVPVVVTIHTRKDYYMKGGLKNLISRYAEKIAFKMSKAKIIAVSEVEYHFLKTIFRGNSLSCIPNGINSNYFSSSVIKKFPREKLGVSKSDFVLLMIGRLAKIKNQELAIMAMKWIVKEHKDVKLVIVGKRGGEEDYYRSLVNELKLNDYIVFAGEFDDIRPIVKTADLGLFLSKREGLSIAMLEMMSMQLPIIFTKIPEFRKLFPDEGMIPFVDPENPEQLAQIIIKLKKNGHLRKCLGKFNRELVKKKFDVRLQVKKHHQLYNSLIKEEI